MLDDFDKLQNSRSKYEKSKPKSFAISFLGLDRDDKLQTGVEGLLWAGSAFQFH